MWKPDGAAGSAAVISFCFWTVVALALFAVLSGQARMWDGLGITLFPEPLFVVIPAGVICAGALILGRFRPALFVINPWSFVVMLLFLFASDWLSRPDGMFQGPAVKRGILAGALVVALALVYLRSRPPAGVLRSLFAMLPWAGAAFLLWTFLSASGGEPIFSDDHSVFLHRLTMLKLNFPFVPFYNPFWNGGFDERILSTGALGIFLAYAPFIYLFKVEQVYNLIVGCSLFILPALACYCAAKLAKLAHPAPVIAALLSLAPGFVWYRWGLAYGTMGFVFSTALLPLGMVLACNLISPSMQLTRRGALAAVVVLTLIWLWPMSIVVFLPLAVGFFLRPRALFRKRHFLACVAALFCLNLPWAAVFWSATEAHRFLNIEKEKVPDKSAKAVSQREDQKGKTPLRWRHKKGVVDPARALKLIREKAHSANPLLLCLMLPGIFLLARPLRYYWLTVSFWLLCLGTVGVPLKPQLELDRMLVLLMMLACVPAAAALSAVLTEAAQKKTCHLALLGGALCGGFLLAGPFAAGEVVGNRTALHLRFMEPLLHDMAEAIRTHNQGGRVIFSGCILHEAGGGHVAPLADMSGVPLIASSPMHTLWWYRQVFPSEYLKRRAAGVQEYLDLYNVGAVMAHEPNLRKYFAGRSEYYEKVWWNGSFSLFRRKGFKSSYFLEGRGQVLSQDSSSVTLKLDTPEAVIKFNYFPFVTAGACRVSERVVSESVQFIELSGCPVGVPVRIEAVPPWRRIK